MSSATYRLADDLLAGWLAESGSKLCGCAYDIRVLMIALSLVFGVRSLLAKEIHRGGHLFTLQKALVGSIPYWKEQSKSFRHVLLLYYSKISSNFKKPSSLRLSNAWITEWATIPDEGTLHFKCVSRWVPWINKCVAVHSVIPGL